MVSLWDGSLSIDVPGIDAEHQDVFDAIESLLEALDTRDAERTAALLRETGERIARNFETEEQLMDDCAYPGAQHHLEGHMLFRADFQQLCDELDRRGPAPVFSIWIRSRIVSWLRFHIDTCDRPLARYARPASRAASPPPAA